MDLPGVIRKFLGGGKFSFPLFYIRDGPVQNGQIYCYMPPFPSACAYNPHSMGLSLNRASAAAASFEKEPHAPA